MRDDDLYFSVAERYDSTALLAEAADRMDALAGHLGEGDKSVGSEYGDLIRAFRDDVAEFGAYPDVYPVPVTDLPGADQMSAARVAALEGGYLFWWLEFPLTLFARRSWAFKRLEVALEFNPDEDAGYRRPKAYDLLPNRRFDTVAEVGAQIGLRLGGDAHFELAAGPSGVDVPGASVQAGVGLAAGAEVQAHLIFRPFQYRLAAARITHTAAGLERVFWRLDGTEFFQENVPRLIVIAQVPKETPAVRVRAVLQAYRHFAFFPAGLQAAIRELPEVLRTFFGRGVPLYDEKPYDLSPRMRPTSGDS